ncbi:MAG: hypothetical protein ACI4PC_05810 [Oscillospiraceae bacterium]
MIALIIILAILLLILLLPVGADVSFLGGALSVKARIGPFRLGLFPRKKRGEEAPKEEKPPKAKKEKKKDKTGKKNPLTMEDIFGIAKLGLKALNRFRKNLSIDVLMLHICAGAPEPYDAVMRYGTLNAALGTLHPLLHRSLKIRREDIATAVSFETEKTTVEARLAATLRIGEILFIGLCAGFGFLAWMRRRKKRAKQLAAEETGGAQTNTAQTNTCS